MNEKDIAQLNVRMITHFMSVPLPNSAGDQLIITRYKAAERELDEHGNVVAERFFDENEALSREVKRAVDEQGRVTEVLEHFDAIDQRFTYEYEGEGEKVLKEFQHYDDGTAETTNFTWEGENLVLKLKIDDDNEEAVREVLIYDEKGRLQEVEKYEWGNKSFSIEYEFDADNNISKEVFADGEDYIENEVAHAYNEAGKPVTAVTTDSKDVVVRQQAHEYDERGLCVRTVETYSRPDRDDQEVVREYEYA
jgi:antitoxin component YwqK of YwqJK toxin-antitoxin module